MRLLLGVVCLATFSFSAFPVLAGSDYSGPERGGCKKSIKQFCPEAKTRKEISHCMKQHKDELPDNCKEGAKKSRDFAKVCRDDIKTFCNNIKPGQGRIKLCLQENKESLSESCRAAMQDAEQKYK